MSAVTARSVLDLVPVRQGLTAREALQESATLAQHVEALGYTRFWVAEHHNMDGVASSATAVLVGHIAGGTKSIRVGSGGVMLPNHAPLAIAEQFGMLEALAQHRALQAKAQRALDRVRAGEPFAGVAAEVSDAADRAAGGDLGLRPVDRLPSLFVDAVRDLKDGALAGPLRSGAGFHVLQLVKRSRDAAALTVIQTRARHILFKSGPKFNEAQATAKLLDFKRLIVAGQADFAALARDNSEDGSAKDGGDLGWTSTGMFVPEFEQVMNQLAPGQIADPLVSRFGVHLLQVMGWLISI